MKRLVLSLLLLFALALPAQATALFWIGGTGNTSDTAHWSASSGGLTCSCTPVAADTIALDTNSGTGTVTVDTALSATSITHSKASLSLSASAAMTISGAVTVTAGTIVTGAFTHSFGSFSSASGTRTVTLTNSTLNITGTSGAPWNVSTSGTLTFTATGSTINFTGGAAGGFLTLNFGTLTYATVSITGAGSWTSSSGSPAVTNFSYMSTTNKTDNFTLGGTNLTIGAGGSLVLAGNSVVNRAFVLSSILGSPRTITVPNTATVSVMNCDFRDITMAGTFSTGATAASIGDALGNTFGWSSVQPDVSVAQTLVGTGTINWSTAANWTSRVPLPQDDVSLGSSSTATTLTADMPRLGRNIDASGYLKTISFASTPNTLFGNVTLGASNTLSGTQILSLAGRGSQTITSNGKQLLMQINLIAFGGTYTVQDTFSCASVIQVSSGTFAAGAQAITALGVTTASVVGTAGLSGTGSWNITRTSGTSVFNMGGFTAVSLASATINLTGTNITSITIQLNGKTYGTLNWSSTASTGTLIITGANTFGTLQVVPGAAKTIQFPASTAQTISTLLLSGGTNYLTVNSSTSGTPATLSVGNAGFVGHNLSVKDITISGAGTPFYAAQSVNVSGNTGWTFGLPPGTPTSTLPSLGVGGWLLKRDLNPANDNSPMWLEKAA